MKFLNNILAQAGLVVSGTANLNGTSTAVTVTTSDNSTNIATTAFVKAQNYLTGITSNQVTNALGYTPVTNARIITINGASYDLSADRTWSVGTITGSGNANYVPKFTGTGAIGNSLIYDNGTGIGINTTPYNTTVYSLDINGGLLVKNTGKSASITIINADPSAGGNNAFGVWTVGGTSGTSYVDIQGYYGASITGSTLIRLNYAGGGVLIGSLSGTGTRMVVVDSTGTLSTQALPSAGGVTSFNTRTGAVTLSSSDVTTALGFTPYNSTNPSGYITASSLSSYLPLAGGTMTGNLINGSGTTSSIPSWMKILTTDSVQSGLGSVFNNKAIYLYNNGSILKLDAYDYSTSTSLNFSIGGNGGIVNIATGATINSNIILHAGNYTSYSPSLTGSGASGTWGINVTGYSSQLNGYGQNVVYTILDGPANGPVIKVRYDGGTANRYIDFGSKDGNGVYYEGFKIYNGGTPTWAGNTIWHGGNLTNLNQLTNGPGYITGITSANVTTALGYTPYNSTNPSGYITSSALSAYLPLGGGTMTGTINGPIFALTSGANYFDATSATYTNKATFRSNWTGAGIWGLG
jgi:hypothetical protein